MRRQRRKKRLPSVGAVITAAVFIGIGIFMLHVRNQSAERYDTLTARCTSQSTGTVTNIRVEEHEHEDADGDTYIEEDYIYTVTFSVDNTSYTAKGTCGYQRYDMEENLSVRYAPEEPDVNYIEVFMTAEDHASDQKFLTMLGAGCIGFGILMLFIA